MAGAEAWEAIVVLSAALLMEPTMARSALVALLSMAAVAVVAAAVVLL